MCNLVRMQSLCERLQDLALFFGKGIDNLLATQPVFCLLLLALRPYSVRWRALEHQGEEGLCGTGKGHLDQLPAILRRDVHNTTVIIAPLDRLRCIEVQKFIRTFKVEQSCGESEEGHEASPAGDGEMDDVLSLLQITNQFANRIERAVRSWFINDIIDDIIVIVACENLLAKVDGQATPLEVVTVPGELGAQPLQGLLHARRGRWMDNDDFVDRGAAFEQQVECEGHDLGLATEGCHQRMFIPTCVLRGTSKMREVGH